MVDVTFTTMSERVNAFARDAQNLAGLSETMAKQYVGTFGAMAKSFKFTEEEAYNMSTALTQMAGDVASFYNLTQKEAYTKLKSVFTGETESLKDLGVVMTQTALDAYALEKGFGKTTAQMTEQEKVALRYRFVMDQLSGASGDFARTSGSWANQTRLLALQFDQLKATLGSGLINILTPVLKVLNSIIAKLQVLAEKFRQFTVLLFGEAGNSTGAALSEAADAADDLTGSVTAAGKAAKKSLAPFDELNKIGGETESATSSLGSTGGGATSSNADEAAEKESSGLAKQLTAFAQQVRDILQPLSEWTVQDAAPATIRLLRAALKALSKTLKALKPLWSWLWDNLLGPLVKWTGQAAVDGLNAIADALTSIGNWISDHETIVQAATVTVAAFFAAWQITGLMGFIVNSGGVISALKGITAAVKAGTIAKIADKAETAAICALYAKDWAAALGKNTLALGKELAGWIALGAQWVIAKGHLIATTAAQVAHTAATWLGTTATTAFGAAMSILTSPITLVVAAIAALIAIIVLLVKNWDTVKEAAANAWEKIKAAWNSAAAWFNTNIVKPVAGFFSGLWSGIQTSAANAWQKLKEAWNGVATWFNSNIVKPVSGFFSNMWSGLKTGAANAWNGVKSVFSSVATFFKDTFSKAWKGVVNIFSSDGNIFADIKDGIVTAFKSIVNKLISGINSVIAVPFNGINSALKTVKSIKILGLEPFAKLPTISVPKIPYLAKGAVIPPNAPFMAVLGDQRHGTNIEAPLSTIQEAVARENLGVIDAIYEMTRRIVSAVLQSKGDIILDGVRMNRQLSEIQTDETQTAGTPVTVR